MIRIGAALLAAGLSAFVPSDTARLTHTLNRTAFGPAPYDVERARTIGLDRYVDEQLHPERIDDSALERRLGALATLTMTSRDLAARFGRNADDGLPNMRNRPVVELASQKMIRAVWSRRQLQEVLTDFWFNHFNVDARKGPTRFMLAEYEREVIRPHVFGTFRDLLGAVAKSPAMLFYLDNWMNTAPLETPRGVRRGLNENYARELLELHTLGVDGGYTQQDVHEVARAFTGWTIDRPREGGPYRFVPRLHDDAAKTILGHAIAAGGGESDGERVLDLLARHPSTARFIATKLARLFINDDPPKPVIERAAARFLSTGGDLREVVRTILESKEFQSPSVYGAKIKTPLQFVVSALRETGAVSFDARDLRALQELGMPLYQCQPPTGYADNAGTWLNAGALVSRVNIATRIAAGNQTLTLALGSPEFQRR